MLKLLGRPRGTCTQPGWPQETVVLCCCCCCFGGVAADVLAVVGDRGDAVGACDDAGIVCRRPRGLRRVVGGE